MGGDGAIFHRRDGRGEEKKTEANEKALEG